VRKFPPEISSERQAKTNIGKLFRWKIFPPHDAKPAVGSSFYLIVKSIL